MKVRKGGRSKCGVIHLDGMDGWNFVGMTDGWMDGVGWGTW